MAPRADGPASLANDSGNLPAKESVQDCLILEIMYIHTHIHSFNSISKQLLQLNASLMYRMFHNEFLALWK